jgi:hypothetical protein
MARLKLTSWALPFGWTDLEGLLGQVINITHVPPRIVALAPAAVAVLVPLLLLALLLGWRGRRRGRRLREERAVLLAFGEETFRRRFEDTASLMAELRPMLAGVRELIEEVDALRPAGGGAWPGRRRPASEALIAAAVDAEGRLAALESHRDIRAFERVIRLSDALARLRGAVTELAPASPDARLREVLRDGLETSGWLHPILRAELLLGPLAPPLSHWSRLGTAVGLVAALARAELQELGIEIVSPALLAPVAGGHEVVEGSGLPGISVLASGVRAALAGIADPRRHVVDCVRLGSRTGAGAGGLRRELRPQVVLYNSQEWQ